MANSPDPVALGAAKNYGNTSLKNRIMGFLMSPPGGGVGNAMPEYIAQQDQKVDATVNNSGAGRVAAPSPKMYSGTDYLYVPSTGNQTHKNPALGYAPAPVVPQQQQQQQTSDPTFEGYSKTLADFLPLAQSQGSASLQALLSNLAAKQAALQASAANGDSMLQQMYGALGRSTGAANDKLYSQYNDARANSQAATQQALDAVTASNQNFLQQQNQQRQNLGMGESANDTNSARWAAMNNGLIGTSGNAAVQKLIADQMNASEYGKNMLTAGDFAGTQQRAGLQNNLLSALASLAGQEISARASSSDAATKLAQDMLSSDRNFWLDNQKFLAGRGDAAVQQSIDQQKADAYAQYYGSKSGGASAAQGGPAAAQSVLNDAVGAGEMTPDEAGVILKALATSASKVGSGNPSSAYAAFLQELNRSGLQQGTPAYADAMQAGYSAIGSFK
jgi:hypothetical protein